MARLSQKMKSVSELSGFCFSSGLSNSSDAKFLRVLEIQGLNSVF